jgi:hypothetical protein
MLMGHHDLYGLRRLGGLPKTLRKILFVAGLVAHDRFPLDGKSKAAKHG